MHADRTSGCTPRPRIGAAATTTAVIALALAACGETDPVTDDTAADTAESGTETSAGESTAGGTAPPGGPFSLVTVDDWLPDSEEPAPWADHRPDTVDCEFGFGVEDGVFEIDSGLCTWGAFVQPSLEGVDAGDEIEVILLHDALYSEEEGAAAHVAVALGDTVVWDETVMMPAPPGLLRPAIVAETSVPAGTPIHVHVHNHGYNNYRFVDIIVTHR